MTIEQLTIIFIEQRVFSIPFENSDNLERSLVPQGKSYAFTHLKVLYIKTNASFKIVA